MTKQCIYALNLKHIIHATLYNLQDDDNMQAAYLAAIAFLFLRIVLSLTDGP